jgi:hypothetical protein
MSANDPRIHVGLGALKAVDELVVRWPSGVVDRMKSPELQEMLVVEETKGFSVRPEPRKTK